MLVITRVTRLMVRCIACTCTRMGETCCPLTPHVGPPCVRAWMPHQTSAILGLSEERGRGELMALCRTHPRNLCSGSYGDSEWCA